MALDINPLLFNSLVAGCFGGTVLFALFFVQSEPLKKAVQGLAVGGALLGFWLSSHLIYPRYQGWEFERSLRAEPLFGLIAKTHPQAFAAFLDQAKVQLYHAKEGAAPASVTQFSQNLVNVIFRQHLQHAPDENIRLYLKATLDLYHHLNGQDPIAVVKLETGDEKIPYNLNNLWNDKSFRALLLHLLDTKKFLIEAALKNPVAQGFDSETPKAIQGVQQALEDQYGTVVVRGAFKPGSTVAPGVAAKVIIDFYTAILDQGNEQSARMMRYIAHQQKA